MTFSMERTLKVFGNYKTFSMYATEFLSGYISQHTQKPLDTITRIATELFHIHTHKVCFQIKEENSSKKFHRFNDEQTILYPTYHS